ncbi:MAG: polysaccharide biosynthesis/export family protein, partial [Planctomycetota bacterium]
MDRHSKRSARVVPGLQSGSGPRRAPPGEVTCPARRTGRRKLPGACAVLAATLVVLPLEVALGRDGESKGEKARKGVYLIAPGDTIAIFVAERNDLSTQVRIPLEGSVILPGVGAIEAVGRSVEELSIEIARWLRTEARLVDPRVAVSVVAYGSRRAFVYGSVERS